jgi:hypothetical protein
LYKEYEFIDCSSLIAPADNGLKQAILEFPPEVVKAKDYVLSKEIPERIHRYNIS